MDDVTACDTDGVYRPSQSTATIARSLPKSRTEAIRQTHALRGLQGDRSMLYAIRLDDGVIKIGCTVSLSDRRYRLGNEILAMLPGELDEEFDIHQRLKAHTHHGREYYNPTPEVLAVVNEMREYYNLDPLAA